MKEKSQYLAASYVTMSAIFVHVVYGGATDARSAVCGDGPRRIPMQRFFQDHLFYGVQGMDAVHHYAVNGKIAGALAALLEIPGCVPVLHGPVGCAFHYRRSMRTPAPLYALESTHMRDDDVVFGGEEKLLAVLARVAARKPALIAVLPTCVTDVIQEDIDGVVRRFRETLHGTDAPRVISVASSGFSHRSNSVVVAHLKERVEANGRVYGKKTQAAYRGCGFVEVMEALVDQVMEAQTIVPGTVNIEAFSWGYDGARAMQSVVDMLRAMGIETNTLLPSASCAQIAAAPRAALNIARRMRWARRMEEKFGTPYLHFSNLYEWYGVQGIRDFYLTIAEALGRKAAAERVLAEEERRAAPDLKESRAYLGKFRYGLVSASFSKIPELIQIYEHEYNMKLDFVVLLLPKEYGRTRGLDEATVARMHGHIRAAIRDAAPHAAFYVCPDAAEMARLAQSVDALVGSGAQRYEYLGTPWIPALYDRRAFSMRDYKDVLAALAQTMARRRGKPSLLLSRVRYSAEHYPMLDEPNALASREMWDRMGRMRQ